MPLAFACFAVAKQNNETVLSTSSLPLARETSKFDAKLKDKPNQIPYPFPSY